MSRSLLFFSLTLTTVAVQVPSPQQVCEIVTSDIRSQYPQYTGCTCSSTTSGGGSSATIQCQTCEFCTFGMCVTGKVTAEADVESDSTVTMTIDECWTYRRGITGTVCLETLSSIDNNQCKVNFLGAACDSCQIQTCADGTTTSFLADCTNIDKGLTLDGCSDLVVTDSDSPFIVFDDRFDFSQCSNGQDPTSPASLNNGAASLRNIFTASLVSALIVALVM